MSFPDKRLIDDLLIETRQCLNLAVKEGLDGLDIRCASLHRLSDILEHLSNAGLGILELVFDCLAIEIREIGYWADSGQDCVIADPWRPRSERCYHGDAFSSAEGSEGLVIDVTALQDNTASLELRQVSSYYFDVALTCPLWTSNFLDIPGAGSQGGLAADHASAVAHHENANERIAISVPTNDSFLIIL